MSTYNYITDEKTMNQHEYNIIIDIDLFAKLEETEEEQKERIALQRHLTKLAWDFANNPKSKQNLMNQILGNDGILVP